MRHPYEVQSFIEWLRTKPADEFYLFADSRGCLGYQYLTAMGLPVSDYAVVSWRGKDGKFHDVPAYFGHIVFDGERTFGAALARAEAVARGEVDMQGLELRFTKYFMGRA